MKPRQDFTSYQTHSIITMNLNKPFVICKGIPSIVWQQQMEKTKVIRFNKLQVIHETLPQNQIDFTQIVDSTFRPLPQIEASEENFLHHQYGFDLYWEDHRYQQDSLEYRHNYIKPAEQIEDNNIFIYSHVSDTQRHALIDLWRTYPQLSGTSSLASFMSFVYPNKPRQQPVVDNDIGIQLKSTPDGSIKILPISTNLHPKNKRKMLYFPLDFGDLTILKMEGLNYTGALSSAISQTKVEQIKQRAPQKTLKERPPTGFQIMMANGQLETPIAMTELQIEIGDFTFVEGFIVMASLANT